MADNTARKSFEAAARTAREAAEKGADAAEQATKRAEQSYSSAAEGLRDFHANSWILPRPTRRPA